MSGRNDGAVDVREPAVMPGVVASSRGTVQPITLDLQAIMSILPHRGEVLYVQSVDELVPGRSIVAYRKVVSHHEWWVPGHFPGNPMLPGVLIVEALFQAAGLLVAYSLPPDCQANVGLNCGVEDVKIRKSVVPGDQMKLNASLEDGWFRMGRMCIAKVMASKRVEVNRQYMWEAITNSFNIKIGLTSKSE